MDLNTRFGSEKQSPRPARAREETHKSPALNALFQELRDSQDCRILDLGTASGANIDFLSQFSSKIQIEDLYSTIVASGLFSPDHEPDDNGVFEKLLPFPTGTLFDIILCWDLLDYLGSNGIRLLIDHLNGFCQPGTFLFALCSTLKEMPSKPTTFRILDRETLIYAAESTQLCPSPRYTPRDFTRMMRGFSVYISFLLKIGMQEYLFVHD